MGEADGEPSKALITLSENLGNYVWTAEIQQGDTSQVVITTAPRPSQNRVATDEMLVTLNGLKLWAGHDRILDVTFVFLSNFEQRMVLLLGDGLIITKPEKDAAFRKTEFPSPRALQRDPIGDLRQVGHQVNSIVDGRECDVDVDSGALIGCFVWPGPVDRSTVEVAGADLPSYGDQVRNLLLNCGVRDAVLGAGTGDDTQSDWVQALKGKVAVSNTLNFPGPVLKFSQGPDTQFVSAIVRNLKDGNYEVYRLSTSCGP